MMTNPQLGTEDLTPDTFTPERTRPILDAASRMAGLDPLGAELIRHHTNAVYLLATAPVVIKIARPGLQQPLDVVALVRWLENHDVPSVPLWEAEQPIELAGCDVTYWRYLPQHDLIVSAAELAEPLRRLHNLAERPLVDLPADHLERTFASIKRSTLASAFLSPEDTQFLLTRRNQLLQQLAEVQFALPPTLIHGDAHHRNTLWDNANHRGVLCDWENASLGQPEWDLTTLEVHCRRFEHPRHEYTEFVQRYGYDIRDWSGYRWLRDVRELRMVTTNARKSTPGSANAHEVQRRVAALRAGVQVGWRIM